MRYDDASQAGHAATGLNAHPDVEALAPGSFGPANGNAISGAGTTSGQAGADQVGAGPAAIVEVQGAGGQTVQANGAFQASGQYGLLSMNPDGDFSYVRNPGTPDGVRDVFNYTLADAAGATSSTTLTIDIGQIAAAAAAQGVVTLPAGVEMSDIHVNGRDLVINMPDGTQMVIPGGAVFVPQLVIGDVEVPPTNLAALLIDSEPQPAAGPPQSSGGNFADPVPPLDPGVPLGDLIPPTELNYTPPEFHEVNQFENTKPTIIIETPDNPAGAIDALESVNEKGLPTRNGGEPAGSGEIADGNGSNNSDGSETNTGTIVFTAQDGLDSVTIDGADGVNNPVTITAASVGTTIQGQYGILTITGVNFATGEITYSYTLTDNTSGDNTADHFTVVITDRDGDTATGTLTVQIIDDVPTARNDTDSLDQNNHATGNVMTGVGTTSGSAGADTVGADNAHLTGVSGHDGSDTTFDGSGNLVVHGTFGTLTIDASGNYTYVLDDGSHGGGTDVFNYTLTDGDGDTSQATLTINIPVQNEPPTANNSSVNVSEEGLQNGIPDGTGNPDTTDSAQNSGNIGAVDPDGDPMTITLSAPGPDGQFTSGGADVNWFVSADGHTLIGYTGSDHDANHVIEITIDNTGHYDVNLIAPFDDPDPNSEDSIDFQVPVNVSDGQENIGVHITVTVEDDSPTLSEGRAPLGTVYEDGLPGGNLDGGPQPTELTINSASLAALVNSGADTPLTISLNAGIDGADTGMTEDGISIVWNVIDATHVEAVLSNDASHQVFTVTDNGDGTFTFTLLDNIDNNPLAAGDSDVDTLDLGGLFVATDADGDHVTLTSGVSIDIQNDVPTLGEGSYNVGTVYEDSLPGGNPDGGSQPTTATINASSLAALVSDGADNPVTIGFNADIDGVDTGMTENGVSIVWNVIDATHVEAVLSNDASHQVFTVTDNGDGTFTFTLLDNIDNNPLGAGDSDVDALSLDGLFAATDTDGDTVVIGSGVSIDIQNDVPTVTNVQGASSITFDETSVGDINGWPASSVTSAAAMITATTSVGADTPGTTAYGVALAGGVNSLASGLQTAQGDHAITLVQIDSDTIQGQYQDGGTQVAFTIDMGADGKVTYTQNVPLEHTDDGNTPIAYNDTNTPINFDGLVFATIAVTDSDGDTTTGSTNIGDQITVFDDGPTAVNPDSIVTTDEVQGPITASLDLPDNDVTDNFGADGPGTITFANITNGMDSGLTSGGSEIDYFVTNGGQTIEARVGGASGELVFTVDIDQANSQYIYNQFDTIDNGSGISFSDLSGGVAGNPPFKLITEPGESTELLATPINGTSINSDQNDMGVDSQFIDTTTGADQGVRLDFGNFTYHTNGGGTADDQFSMDSHSSVNGFRFTIDQVSNGTTADVHLKAIDADEDGGVNENTPNAAGDVVAPITEVIIWNGTTLVADFTGSGTINGYTATFSGGEVTIDDLPAGYSIQTFTADPGYDRIEITNPGNNSSGDTDGKFSISEFTIETSNTGEPINLSFDLQVTDSDGDYTTVAGGINIELDPSGSQSAAAVNTLMATNSLSTQSLDTTSLVSSNDNHGQEQRAFQAGFTAALVGAVAAVGLEGAQHGLAHHGAGHESDRGPDFAGVHTQDVTAVSASVGASAPRGGHDITPSSHDDAERTAEHSSHAARAEAKGAELDHAASRVVAELLHGTAGSAHGSPANGDTSHIAAQSVTMPTVQQLAAVNGLAPQASVAGNHNEVVAKVLADALHGGGGDGHNIDALVEAATGSKGSGPNSGINALASHGMATVSNGHTEDFAGFSFGHGGHMIDAMIVHQDAAPAHG